jgi:hypothetical protein
VRKAVPADGRMGGRKAIRLSKAERQPRVGAADRTGAESQVEFSTRGSKTVAVVRGTRRQKLLAWVGPFASVRPSHRIRGEKGGSACCTRTRSGSSGATR